MWIFDKTWKKFCNFLKIGITSNQQFPTFFPHLKPVQKKLWLQNIGQLNYFQKSDIWPRKDRFLIFWNGRSSLNWYQLTCCKNYRTNYFSKHFLVQRNFLWNSNMLKKNISKNLRDYFIFHQVNLEQDLMKTNVVWFQSDVTYFFSFLTFQYLTENDLKPKRKYYPKNSRVVCKRNLLALYFQLISFCSMVNLSKTFVMSQNFNCKKGVSWPPPPSIVQN